jgi:hypothetical protein
VSVLPLSYSYLPSYFKCLIHFLSFSLEMVAGLELMTLEGWGECSTTVLPGANVIKLFYSHNLWISVKS